MKQEVVNKIFIGDSVLDLELNINDITKEIDFEHLPLNNMEIHFSDKKNKDIYLFDAEINLDGSVLIKRKNALLLKMTANRIKESRSDLANASLEEIEKTYIFSILYKLIYVLQMEKEIIFKTKTTKATKTNTKKKNKKNNNNKKLTYIHTYKVKNDTVENFKSKHREYTFKTNSWNVRGHWRTYKSGKKIWINEHQHKRKNLKDGENIENNYKII